MIKPPLLTLGNTIGIVAPARKVQPEQVRTAINVFESWGLQVRLGRNLFSDKHPYLAGTDEERLQDLQAMMDDPSVHAIICARGGYGSTRIIDQLNFDCLKKSPKWIIGFSDITALQLKLLSQDVMSIHGTMPILFEKPDIATSLASLRSVLFDGEVRLEASPNLNNRSGSATGKMVGGNLSLICDAIGTSAEPDTNGSILILEEIDEYYYRLDRMITHLKRAGKLDKLSGLIVGHFSDLKESEQPFKESVEGIIRHATSAFTYPIAFGFPTGHQNPNFAWVQGSGAILEVGKTSYLTSMHLT